MTANKLDLLNEAVAELGAGMVVLSDDVNTTDINSRVASRAFDSVVRDLVSRSTWTFLTKQETLRNAVQRTDEEFKYNFSKPEDFNYLIAGLSNYFDGSLFLFALDSFLADFGASFLSGFVVGPEFIRTNYTPFYLVYQTKREDYILNAPDYFLIALILGIKANVSVSLKQSVMLSRKYSIEYEQKIRQALVCDKMQAQRFYEVYRTSGLRSGM